MGRPLRFTAAALRTRPAVALQTRLAVDLRTRPVEALCPATAGLGTASPGGATVARLPAIASAVLQGAMSVVAAANPVGVAAELRAQPGVMLAQSIAVVDAVARLPAVAVAVLQGAMAVVAAANPVEVAAELRAQPGVMLAQ